MPVEVDQQDSHSPAGLPLTQRHGQSSIAEPWVADSFLFFVMGMSGWWVINAIQWAESPIFVHFTPEKERIGNWLSVSCALGNVFPVFYKGALSKAAQSRLLTGSVLTCQVLAVATAVVCAVAWKTQANVLGKMHSVVLIVCAITAGGVGTLSNVTYWALAVRYPGTHCIKAMSVGMTVGGLVVASLALVQKAGKAPIFGVDVFMLGVAAVQALFTLSFLSILRRTGGSRRNPSDDPNSEVGQSLVLSGRSLVLSGNLERSFSRQTSLVLSGPGMESRVSSRSPRSDPSPEGFRFDTQLTPPSLTPQISDPVPFIRQISDPVPFTRQISDWEISRRMQVLILFVMFMVYALTYSLPSLGPIMVNGYKSSPSSEDLLRLMNVLQQLGDVLGRVATALPYKPGVVACGVMTVSVFIMSLLFIIAAVFAADMPNVIVGGASYLFPVLFFVYYFVRGNLVTVLYVQVKLGMKPEAAENFAGKMGLLGQVGSLFSNLALFFAINVVNVF